MVKPHSWQTRCQCESLLELTPTSSDLHSLPSPPDHQYKCKCDHKGKCDHKCEYKRKCKANHKIKSEGNDKSRKSLPQMWG